MIRPFKGIRPVQEKAAQVACKPYDVINKIEARQMAQGKENSFLHVIKPEIDLPDTMDEHAIDVYKKGIESFNKLLSNKVLFNDTTENIYIYAQTMDGRTQYGIMACASAEEYLNGTIKEHELTRPDKEEDRKNHIRYSNKNYEPVFFAYPAKKEIDEIVSSEIKKTPDYNFIADDGIGHHLWTISDKNTINSIVELFKKVPHTYVADGHHRSNAAAKVAKERKEANANHNGNEEYNFFLAVHFPDNQLKIFDYNRVVKDLNGLSASEFIEKLHKSFVVEEKGNNEYKPEKLHQMSMYLGSKWYSLSAKQGTYNDSDPIACLDVTILSEQLFEPILGIKDLRTDKRIDFVGGIRGLGELKKRVDSGEMAVAFALYAVSMKQLFDIADTNNIMPPKTTWFEPKLRSGLMIHSLI